MQKIKKLEKLLKNFKLNCAYNPPKNYSGSVLDGRDITSVIMKDAMFKFYITANFKSKSKKKRFKEFKKLKKKITYKEV